MRFISLLVVTQNAAMCVWNDWALFSLTFIFER